MVERKSQLYKSSSDCHIQAMASTRTHSHIPGTCRMNTNKCHPLTVAVSAKIQASTCVLSSCSVLAAGVQWPQPGFPPEGDKCEPQVCAA